MIYLPLIRQIISEYHLSFSYMLSWQKWYVKDRLVLELQRRQGAIQFPNGN